MKYTILGGGLSALSAAYFLQQSSKISQIDIYEKEEKAGGLCRSFCIEGIKFDIGPHIIFSKDKDILELMNNFSGSNKSVYKRSNKIVLNGRLINYPFENDLSKLDKESLNYAVNTFINNPYKNYKADNMLQFFYKTFGEGITNLYLLPYNEKIWKFPPAFMDLQIIERLPAPSNEDILRSAEGETVDGYLHQLYFTYPEKGGIETLIDAFKSKLSSKVHIYSNSEIVKIKKQSDNFIIKTKNGKIISAENIISSIPLNYLAEIYESSDKPAEVIEAAKQLKYNSIIIGIVNVKKDYAGSSFAFTIPDRSVIFHRISKLDFYGSGYHIKNSITYMIEITFRKNDVYDNMDSRELEDKIISGLKTLKFISSEKEINFIDLKKFEYAYVIYDLMHRKNTDIIKKYFEQENITLLGRFGAFEYINMDAAIKSAMQTAENITKELS